jgi:glyoxylase-like metal-dependent hydrolase (beta-lactamase superfamily II)
VVGAPGHTAGSIAVHLPAHRILLTGDSIARAPDGRVILGPFNVDRNLAIASLRQLAELDVDVACFGHGDPVLSGATAELRSVAARVLTGDRRLQQSLLAFTSALLSNSVICWAVAVPCPNVSNISIATLCPQSAGGPRRWPALYTGYHAQWAPVFSHHPAAPLLAGR